MRAPRTGPVAVVLAPVRACAAWVRRLRDGILPQRFGAIADGAVYRSGRLTARAVRIVRRRYGIRTIVDLGAANADAPARRAEMEAIRELGIRRVGLVLTGDGCGVPERYAAAVRILADPASYPVLVHCAAGVHRTSTAAVLYLQIVRGWTYEEAARSCRRYGCDLARRPAHAAYLRRHLAEIRAGVLGAPVAIPRGAAPVGV